MIKKPTLLSPTTQIVLELDSVKSPQSDEPSPGNVPHGKEEEKKKKEMAAKLTSTQKMMVNLMAGSLAGALAKTTIAPLDRTKINFQIKNTKFTFLEAARFMKSSVQSQGILSLWRGNSATMARIIPYAALQYTAHEHLKTALGLNIKSKEKGIKLKLRHTLAGSLAGVFSSSMTYPLDLARARMAVTHKEKYNSLTQVFRLIIREEGVRTLYRGYLPTLLGVIPYAGTSFCTYETLKRYHSEKVKDNAEPNPLERMLYGAIAGLFGQSASYPLDIVRRRFQTSASTNIHYTSILGTLRHVARTEGIVGGFYKGLSLNWIKGPISVGISFMTFDLSQKFLISFISDPEI
ncbi:SLC25A42 [Cordylochernes scorpioides]|uniref:SLC25A42 n=1 Tax=Cordylochernes scorpioides TaxID=51811 RepID=A0ABY6L2V5_9ARAC|nr:SLC25A42 [Cordylochernes scorpioides]